MEHKLIVISSPEKVKSEIRKVVSLFREGMQQYHVRKPGFTDFDMISYITAIPKEYRKHLILHSHYHIAKELNLKGIQVGKNRVLDAKEYMNDFKYVGYSAHSFEEILENKEQYTHFILGPIYNSFTKKNYKSSFEAEELSSFTTKNPAIKLIAIGGLDKSNSKQTLDLGFSALALLGSVWQQDEPAKAFTEIQDTLNSRPYAISIAGFDPSSGAGVTADIKTFEQHKVQGLGVSTSITYQDENEFQGVDWLSYKQIKKQVDVLLKKYNPDFVKVGLIENFEVIKKVVEHLKKHNKNIKIIWDPILKSSSGFSFHEQINEAELSTLLQQVYLITPNIPECEQIFGTHEAEKLQQKILGSNLCKILLKGGHAQAGKGTDILIEEKAITNFVGGELKYKTKHGTGCILSSAICSGLAKGLSLRNSIEKAKNYIDTIINSNSTLLAYHNNTK